MESALACLMVWRLPLALVLLLAPLPAHRLALGL
jgi:hypothetical protein